MAVVYVRRRRLSRFVWGQSNRQPGKKLRPIQFLSVMFLDGLEKAQLVCLDYVIVMFDI